MQNPDKKQVRNRFTTPNSVGSNSEGRIQRLGLEGLKQNTNQWDDMEPASLLAQSNPVRIESTPLTRQNTLKAGFGQSETEKVQIGLLLAEICYVTRHLKHRFFYRSIR